MPRRAGNAGAGGRLPADPVPGASVPTCRHGTGRPSPGTPDALPARRAATPTAILAAAALGELGALLIGGVEADRSTRPELAAVRRCFVRGQPGVCGPAPSPISPHVVFPVAPVVEAGSFRGLEGGRGRSARHWPQRHLRHGGAARSWPTTWWTSRCRRCDDEMTGGLGRRSAPPAPTFTGARTRAGGRAVLPAGGCCWTTASTGR